MPRDFKNSLTSQSQPHQAQIIEWPDLGVSVFFFAGKHTHPNTDEVSSVIPMPRFLPVKLFVSGSPFQDPATC